MRDQTFYVQKLTTRSGQPDFGDGPTMDVAYADVTDWVDVSTPFDEYVTALMHLRVMEEAEAGQYRLKRTTRVPTVRYDDDYPEVPPRKKPDDQIVSDLTRMLKSYATYDSARQYAKDRQANGETARHPDVSIMGGDDLQRGAALGIEFISGWLQRQLGVLRGSPPS